MTCPLCLCPIEGETARILVCESPTKPGVWAALRCPQCGHFSSRFDVDSLEYAPTDGAGALDARWLPLRKSPAQAFKDQRDADGAADWIARAIAMGKRWSKRLKKDGTNGE